MSRPFGFPDPVNEVSARLVAGGVVLIAATALLFGQTWLVLPLAYGFVARVLAGPRFSPLGQFVTRVVTPALTRRGVEPRPVPGPPKRFAQGIGAVVTVGASIAWFGFGSALVANLLLAMLVVAAGLESVFGYCIGCRVFGLLMRAGVIPADTCAKCNNFVPGTHRSASTASPRSPETPGARHQAFQVRARQTGVNSSSRGSFS